MSSDGFVRPYFQKDIFDILENPAAFEACYCSALHQTFYPYMLRAEVSELRLHEAHAYWVRDLKRVSDEFGGNGLDHFKRAGHLAYWLRRSKPINCIGIDLDRISTKADLSPEDAYKEEYEFLFKHGNEYIAFEAGFRCVQFYETYREDRAEQHQDRIKTAVISWDYVETVSYFLNAKNVSPHALFLIYKALFEKLW